MVSNETFFILLYTVLSLMTRLWRIGRSATVIWDEVSSQFLETNTLFSSILFTKSTPASSPIIVPLGPFWKVRLSLPQARILL